MDDDDIIKKAYKENWILMTNDKDFGEKIYREQHPHMGVVLLRLEDERAPMKIQILKRLFENHIDRLPGQFIVITERTVRFARVQ